MSYVSRKDKRPRVGVVYYYARLTNIVQIRYTNNMKYVLFKCDWVDNTKGEMEDAFKFTLVNFNCLLYPIDRVNDEPFILSSQAKQVWYVPNSLEPDWQVVVKMSQRGLFYMNSNDNLQVEPNMTQHLEDNAMLHDEEIGWVRA
ncbi:hypothetical protein ACSBR2_025531 [Camellia fascicularis]